MIDQLPIQHKNKLSTIISGDLGRDYSSPSKITFAKEGGVEDFENVFYSWFDMEDYSKDYLAYCYIEKKGTGMKFRKAYNTRRINGIMIQDYVNMKPKSKELNLEKIHEASYMVFWNNFPLLS